MRPEHPLLRGASVCWVAIGMLAGVSRADEPKPVSFPAADGMRIAADYYAPPTAADDKAPVAILLHQYRSDRKSWQPLIGPLREAGFAILAIDLRGHGESATTETREAAAKREPELFRDMQNDVLGAYDWLAAQPGIDRGRFVLVGASVGCSVALQYAARDRSVDAVVCLSPGLKYMGLDSEGDIRQITGREIWLLATEDESEAPNTLQKRAPTGVKPAAGDAPAAGEKRTGTVKVQIYQGTPAHGTALFGKEPGLAQEIATFLKEAVGEAAKKPVFGSIEKNIYHEPDSEWIKHIAKSHLRYYSSAAEAQARGLRAANSKGPADPNTPAKPPEKARPKPKAGR